jgi:acyl-CoA synthetase (AMP-forming)/AMP-acid ligase II/acyl carrier protein
MQLTQDNIVKSIKQHAVSFPQKTAFIYVNATDASETKISYGELLNKIQALAGHLQFHALCGKKALLMYDKVLDFIISFFACQYTGTVAVPIFQVKKNTLTSKTQKIIRDAGIDVILCSNDLVSKISHSLDLNHSKHLSIHASDLNYPPAIDPKFPEILNTGTSFIQYTSGSTDDPKGVVITHENLIHNQRQIKQAFNADQESIIFSWLPFHHDMGLVGNIIHAVYIGCTCILASPYYFFQQPRRWIEAISKYKVTHSGGPNFAYDLCVTTMVDSDLSKIDLSSWKVAFNGSEHVKADTITKFSNFFSPCGFKISSFFPCYGLAESTLLVSGIKDVKPPTIISIDKDTSFKDGDFIQLIEKSTDASSELVSCGKIPSGLDVKILLTKRSLECKELQLGEIWIAGPNVTEGYWNRSDDDYFIELDGKRYLETGDTGFFHNDELFVIGRAKELFIIRGKNYYPYEIEKSVSERHSALEPNGVVVFENPNQQDGFIVVAELKRRYVNQIDLAHLINSIGRSIVSDTGIAPSDILLVKPHRIPRTSSGKPQRLLCKELYSKNSLSGLLLQRTMLVNRPGHETKAELLNDLLLKKDSPSVKKYLVHVITSISELTDPGSLDDAPFEFNEIGIDSLRMMEIINTINKDLQINLQATDVFINNTLGSLISIIEQMLWLKYSAARGKEIVL